MSNALTTDEQMAMVVVTFCQIGDVQTFFEMDRDADAKLTRARTSMNYSPPGTKQYLTARQFLKHRKVQGEVKKGLFKADNKRYLEAHKKVLEYIKAEGLMQ